MYKEKTIEDTYNISFEGRLELMRYKFIVKQYLEELKLNNGCKKEKESNKKSKSTKNA